MAKKKAPVSDSSILITQKESVAEIRLNRPEVLNAFNVDLAENLGSTLKKVSKDKSIRAVILRGEGRGFSAGGDLKMFHQMLPRADLGFRKISALLNQAVIEIRTMAKPVIAGVHGPAFAAGFGLILSCDLILASKSATFSASFIQRALTPNGSSTIFLPRMIGLRRANECFFTGRMLSAEEACDWGIINRVVDDEKFETALQDFAQKLAVMPTRSIGKIKHLMNQSLGISLSTQLEKEKNTIAWSATTPDFAEGVTAFVEKRKAHFRGK